MVLVGIWCVVTGAEIRLFCLRPSVAEHGNGSAIIAHQPAHSPQRKEHCRIPRLVGCGDLFIQSALLPVVRSVSWSRRSIRLPIPARFICTLPLCPGMESGSGLSRMSFNVSCSTYSLKSPDRIAGIKKPRAINPGLRWSLSQPVLRRLLQTSQPAMVGVPDDASKIPTRRFSGESRLYYLTANEVSNPSLESRLNKNRHFVKCSFLDKSYFIENIYYRVTLFNI